MVWQPFLVLSVLSPGTVPREDAMNLVASPKRIAFGWSLFLLLLAPGLQAQPAQTTLLPYNLLGDPALRLRRTD
jgi:hypothetical protein